MRFIFLAIFVVTLLISNIKALIECGEYGNGRLKKLGDNFRYEVCINPAYSETYFSYHRLKAKSGKSGDRSCEWKTVLYENQGEAYMKGANSNRFQRLGINLGTGTEMFFVHFHLTPASDFTVENDINHSKLTCYVENCVPGFQKVNNGNWRKIEDAVRKSITDEYEIITGQFGQLILPSSFGAPVVMTLEYDPPDFTPRKENPEPTKPYYNHIKVPEYFYKIVRNNTLTGETFVIVTSNNPFMQRFDISMHGLCTTDICSTNSKFHRDLKNYSKGYTYCCKYSEFATNMQIIYHTTFDKVLKGHTVDAVSVPF